jgi:RNA polymerase sigma-70 factor (ECF subfamily)
VETIERDPAAPDVLQALIGHHREFLAFLERRLGSRAAAEDVLQDGFARALERGDSVRDGESAVAWFYRVLRNALIDHHRSGGAEDRALAWVEGTSETATGDPGDDFYATACRCVVLLVDTLKSEYGSALKRIDLDGASLADYAREAGITPNNAGVRVHRAREALRRQVERSCRTCLTHGCLDCSCGGRGR